MTVLPGRGRAKRCQTVSKGRAVRAGLAVLLAGALIAACGSSGGSSGPSSSAVPTSSEPTTPGPSSTGSTTGPVVAAHPNIVFVLTDDLSDNLVTKRYMPILWNLEQEGTSFPHYFVTDSLCCPSRASIFTGRYPHDTGVFLNLGPDGGIGAFNSHGDQYSTLATDLQSAGYRTAMMGKYLNRYTTNEPPAPGWNEWDVAGNAGYHEFNYVLNENGRQVAYGGPDAPKDNYLTDVLSDRAVDFIHTSTAAIHPSPFYLEVATYAPHSPYTPAPRYAHLYPDLTYPRTPAYGRANVNPPSWLADKPALSAHSDRNINLIFRRRVEAMKSVDDMIGRLVDTLKATGVWDNTYLVFSSDNGLHMGEHRLQPGKLTAFDTDINTPLIVVGPHVPIAHVASAFAENIDLRPTFDSWAGTEPSEPIDGRTLLPLLEAGPTPKNWPEGVLVEHRGPDVDPMDPDYPARDSGNPTTYEALRLENALYVEYADGEREYYDLTTDPYEIDNIYTTLPAAYVAELHTELARVEHCRDRRACSFISTPTPPG